MSMTVEELDSVLNEWARHVSGRLSGGFLGLPSHCTYLSFAIKSTGAAVDRSIPERAWRTDLMVRRLGEENMDLRRVIEVAYLGPALIKNRAHSAGMSHRTYLRRFEEAQQRLIALFAE